MSRAVPGAAPSGRPSAAASARLDAAIALVGIRREEWASGPGPSFVPSDLPTVRGALERVRRDGLARGPRFCEWGSGLGGATSVAALLRFDACGIEIEAPLVAGARRLARELGADARFARGSFVRPEDAAFMAGSFYAPPDGTPDGHAALGLEPAACDVVFAYPWPGEEELFDALFMRRTTPGALLLTFHGDALLLVQRHADGASAPAPLGWM